MAESALSLSLDYLRQSIIQKSDQLAEVEEEIREIEEELEQIVVALENTQADSSSSQFVEQISDVIRRAEDFIDTYTKKVSDIAATSICRKRIYWIQQRRLWRRSGDLNRIRNDASSLRLRLHNCGGGGGAPPLRVLDDFCLRQCVFYFTLFPAGFQVPPRRLIALWVAEGLIRPNKHQNEPVERAAERYLDELILRGWVTAKKKPNGKVQACELIDRDTWLMKAKEANFIQNRTGNIGRFVDQNVPFSPYSCRDFISFLSFDTREGMLEAGGSTWSFLDVSFNGYSWYLWLRVLDLERVFRPSLTKALGELIHLRYLGLRWTYLEELPKFINKLLKLQVLDIKHTYIPVLPKSIWSMQHMRHLYLNEAYRVKFPNRPLSGASLADLQTLWGAFIDEDTHVRGELDDSRDIRKLGLLCRSSIPGSSMSAQLKAVDEWISNLKSLENLRLKSRDDNGKPADLHLTSLRGNTNLSTVYLLGKLDPLVVREFPVSLTDITLSGSELDFDPMEFLGRLPCLQILRLLAGCVVDRIKRLRCPANSFPQLKVLKIWKVESLEEWEAEEGSLPCLEELEIRSCANLKRLPDRLGHVSTIRKFMLTSMPVEFVREIKVRQPQLWAKIELHLDSEQ